MNYHSFPEFNIKGTLDYEHQKWIESYIPDLKGKTILDLGAWDGYYSYVAIKKGAKFAVGLDHAHGEICAGGSFETLYEKYSKFKNVHLIPMDVHNIDKLLLDFDVIFCFGLFYHVEDPYTLFKNCFKKCKEFMILEGHSIPKKGVKAYFLDKYELNNDPSNYWSMTPDLIIKMLKRIGFKEVKLLDHKNKRALFIAYK